MVAMRYNGNVMTTTMSQYSDDVSSVTHAGCICAPVNAITCIYFAHRSGPYKEVSKKVVRVTTMWLCDGRKKYNKFSL